MKATVTLVNKALKKLGHAERLHKGRGGYFYFYGGAASDWYSSSVYVNSITAFTVDGWIDQRRHLSFG